MTGVVLAGGKSSRMGREKALLRWQGQPLVRRVVEVLQEVFPTVRVVTPSEEVAKAAGVPSLSDRFPERGPLGGIHAALAAVGDCFVCATDMPFLKADFIQYLCSLAEGWDVVVPRVANRPETLHAIYRATCLTIIERQLTEGVNKVAAFFPLVRVRFVEEAECRRFDAALRMFVNVNTPDEYRQVTTNDQSL
ncbi:MAG: molybdenum cofactor guanylyltransferase [Abditibacteriales bacterium]|nr:molybdenum cofactor guanylyltransferase [Abditibacteriales bacterium]MDW8366485.1 molybdenum cofactor guanylyltransferase [Abditibacteriales bacterium]